MFLFFVTEKSVDVGCVLVGVHRSLSLSKIRSLRMDSKVWKPSIVQVTQMMMKLMSVCCYGCVICTDRSVSFSCIEPGLLRILAGNREGCVDGLGTSDYCVIISYLYIKYACAPRGEAKVKVMWIHIAPVHETSLRYSTHC